MQSCLLISCGGIGYVKSIVKTEDILAAAERFLAHLHAATTDSASELLSIPSQNYREPQVFDHEVERLFKRLPLVLAFSCEIPHGGYNERDSLDDIASAFQRLVMEEDYPLLAS